MKTIPQNPLVTVVMATYTGDDLDHLRQCIDSILTQTYQKIELLIAIDGPIPSASDTYLTQLEANNAQVRLIRIEVNSGAAYARNAAFRESKGDFIAVADADDTSTPDRIEKQLRYLQETNTDVVSAFMNYLNDNNEIIGHKDMAQTHQQIRKTAILLNPINNACVMARAQIFHDFPYDETIRRGHDYNLWARLLVAGYQFGNIPEYLCNFRIGNDFLARRSHGYFSVVLRARLILTQLYPWYLRPFATILAIAIASLRLLPPSCLKLVYKIRNNMRASNNPPASAPRSE